jgi:hypothetical protein
VQNQTGATHLFVNGSSGYVGIGTAAPTAMLQILQNVAYPGPVVVDINNPAQNGIAELDLDGGGQGSPQSWRIQHRSNNNMLSFISNGNPAMILVGNKLGVGATISGTQASTISSYGNLGVGIDYYTIAAPSNGAIIEGNVGIGTSAPTQALDVNGSINVSGTGADIYIGTVKVCREDGTNCPAAAAEADPLWSGNQSLYYLKSNPLGYFNTSNDGAGSELDGDTLDGQHGEYYYQASNPLGFYNSSTLPATAYQSSAAGWVNDSTTVRLANNATNVSVGYLSAAPVLFVDNKNGRVGIGTKTPAAALETYAISGTREATVGIGKFDSGSTVVYGVNAFAKETGCFLAGTKVLTVAGERNIEDIRSGDFVLSYNLEKGVAEPGLVTMTFIHEVSSYLIITDDRGDTINVTAVHPIYTPDGWVAAGDLKVGGKIATLVGETLQFVSIVSIQHVPVNGTVTVYNLEVDGNHDYFANGLLVHNKPGAYGVYGSALASGLGTVAYGGYFNASAAGGGIAYGLVVSTGKVGIGTTAPTQQLDVNGSINVSGTGADIWVGGTKVCLADGTNCPAAGANSGWLNSTTTVWLANNATNVSINNGNLFVDNANNRVGIGTSAPTQMLDVNGSVNISGSIITPPNISIGSSAIANGTQAIALGQTAKATDATDIAVGSGATATSGWSIAIGDRPTATSYAVAIGRLSNAGGRSVAIGLNAVTGSTESVALGEYSNASAYLDVAIGPNALTAGPNRNLAIGASARAQNGYSLAIGYQANASGTHSIAIGNGASAAGAYSAAFGDGASTSIANQLVIGNLSQNLNTQIFGTLNTTGQIYQNNVKVCLSDGTNCQATAPGAETDPLWSGNQSLYYLKSNPLGYYNSSTFTDYYPKAANPLGYYNSTTLPAQSGGYQSSAAGWVNNSQNTSTMLNVGIGTETPAQKLSVSGGSAYIEDTANSVYFNTGLNYIQIGRLSPSDNMVTQYGALAGDPVLQLASNWQTFNIVQDSTNKMAKLVSNGAGQGISFGVKEIGGSPRPNAMVINSNGNVGIGTTDPQSLLDVTTSAGDDAISAPLRISNIAGSASGRPAMSFFNTAGNLSTAQISSSPGSGYTASKLFFSVADSGKNLQDRMVIDTNGNVGIGTTTPTQKLEVNGSINVTQGNISVSTNYSMCFNENCTARIYYNGTALVIQG